MSLIIREAEEDDLTQVRDIFRAVYGDEYPYRQFYDLTWLKRSIYSDDILMLVAEDAGAKGLLGTGSVMFDVGAHSDLIGEFGRLAVHPDACGRGVGHAIMEKRITFIQNRLHLGVVENRAVHPFSQQISAGHGFSACGFLPLKHRFGQRESIALYARHFGPAMQLRRNHPRIIMEAAGIAQLANANMGLAFDAITDETSPGYPLDQDFVLEDFEVHGLPSLMRIERGRVTRREIFGPVRLQYGFFKLRAQHARYLTAKREGLDAIAGAVGFIHDEGEQSIRIFELILSEEQSAAYLLKSMLNWAKSHAVEYIETDVSAHSPRMQRTLLQLGFMPIAYVPAMVFCDVERLDVIKMAKLLTPPLVGEVQLTEPMWAIADTVMAGFHKREMLPQIAEAVPHISLFEHLSDEQIRRVAAACAIEEHEQGQPLFESGTEADELHLLLSGSATVQMDGETVGQVHKGEAVGEMALLAGTQHSASVLATQKVVSARLNRGALNDLARQRPDISLLIYQNLARELADKLRRTDRALGTAAIVPESSSTP